MAWTRQETITKLIILLIYSFCLGVTAIALIVYNLIQDRQKHEYTKSFLYLVAVVFGTGMGCTCFRIIQMKVIGLHAAIHTFVLVLMLVGHRDLLGLLVDGKKFESINKYPISLLSIAIYIFQYIMSYHFVLFRYGRTRSQRIFRTGLHAFTGALTCFVCVMDGVLACHKIEKDEKLAPSILHNLATVLVLCYGICTWYLFLNPYFDWRRLNGLARQVIYYLNDL